jgi:hypothetical protein
MEREIGPYTEDKRFWCMIYKEYICHTYTKNI